MRKIFPFFISLLLIVIGCSSNKKSHVYEIGIDASWYPLQLTGQEKNILAFSIDLLVEIAKKEHLELAIVKMNWDNLLWGLREKKYKAVLSSMRPYTFYLKEYTFSDPYLMVGPVLITREDSKIKNIDDLQGKEVAVIRGSSGALLLQTSPGVILRPYETIPEILEALDDFQVEAAVGEILIVQDFIRNMYQDKLKIVGNPLTQEGLRLISLFSQAEPLIKNFDRGLSSLKKSGDYEKLLRKWGLSPDGKPVADLEIELFLQKYL